MSDEIKYKFENPTPGWVGAVVLNEKNESHGIPIEPGGSVWLSRTEQRLTAEAPRQAEHNPFVATWQCPVAWTEDGEPTRFETRTGTLVLSTEAPRPILSDRAMPDLSASTGVGGPAAVHGDRPVGTPEPAPEVTGAPPLPSQPPVEGQPSEDEVIATPDAPDANDEALAQRRAEEAAARAAATAAAKEDAAISGRARAAAKVSTPPALI